MGANIAARRAAKALRRKAVVAEKRKVETVAGSRAGQLAAAAKLPIRQCLLQESLFDSGMGTLILTRGASGAHVSAGIFLIDSMCLGVKDVFFRTLDREELEMMCEAMDDTGTLRPIDPASARKLLRDVTAWAKQAGFNPHTDFAAVEKLFGDVDPNASDAVFTFGQQGTPLYIPGPSESRAEIRERLAILEPQIEEGSAHFLVPV
jgi:hypothetical protein